MPRSINNVASHRRRKKILKLAKGYRLSKSKLIKTAKESVDRALSYAYRDRKQKKRQFRRLWITRINAACRLNGISYSKFIGGLSAKKIELNRKVLSELAINNPAAFTKVVETVKSDKPVKAVKTEAAAKTEKPVKAEKKAVKTEKTTKTVKAEKPAKTEKAAKPAKTTKTAKKDKTEKPE